MKIQVLSDLHLEFFKRDNYNDGFISIDPSADVIVLAGDIDVGEHSLIQANHIVQKHGKHVVWVPGNHEFYHQDFWKMMNKYHKTYKERNTGVSILLGIGFNDSNLSDHSFIINGVKFCGGTLWTDFNLYSGSKRLETNRDAMRVGKNSINDFKLIQNKKRTFLPEDCVDLYKRTYKIIEKELSDNFNGKKVVVTHHGVSDESVHSIYRADSRYLGSKSILPHEDTSWMLNPCFVSKADELVKKADLWIHGHTHRSLDYKLGNCRVVANPRGYPLNRTGTIQWENPDYDATKIIEI